MMTRFTQKQLRSIGNEQRFYDRVKQYQHEHNTTGLPSPYDINVECIGYSAGYYGCNGSLFRDLTTGEMFGIGRRDYTIFIR